MDAGSLAIERPSPSRKPWRFAHQLHNACPFLILALLLTACARWTPSPTEPPTPNFTPTILDLPDLAVVSVNSEMKSIDSCSNTDLDLVLRIVVRNQGSAEAGSFQVEANGARYSVEAGLQPGQQIRLELPRYQVESLVIVDVLDQVSESDEANNQLSARVAAPTLPAKCQQTPTPALSFQEPLFSMQGHTASVTSVAFSPNGGLIASASIDNTLRLWRVQEGLLLRTMQGHPFPVLAVDFAPLGTTLATGSSDGLVRIWEVSSGLLQRTLTGHGGWVNTLDYSKDGNNLASGGDDFTVRIWRLSDGRQFYTVDEGMSTITSLTYSPDGRMLAWTESNGMVRIWRIINRTWMQVFYATSPAASLAFTPDGAILAAGYADGNIKLWTVQEGELLQILQAHTDTVSGLAFSPAGDWLVSASRDHTLKLWQVIQVAAGTPVPSPSLPINIRPVRLFLGHQGPVTSVAFSPQGELIASGSEDTTVRIWPVPEG